ncbi:Hypothetical protein R9X50_00068100 [Acrodontium crateriforme]|uniref:Metallo-beta-lactamase domain-containing protein n=1 Tax=Acrodontium crateriforme TaxID=150365 RepID=A0AAQ3R543_9PEZI|nr:Hypothetical protein R9X50_00068100 [Acrodontium crateriforme]
MTNLIELDSLEILVIIDNELDPISASPNPSIEQTGGFGEIAQRAPLPPGDRAIAELRMDNICCSAHGLSVMITGIRGSERHTLLFDTGPEESAFERNARRLRAELAQVEVVHLSHWHRDHSGGMIQALRMIHAAKVAAGRERDRVVVDLHPARPDFRGMTTSLGPVSLEADPSFDEIEATGAKVVKCDEVHTVLEDMFLVSGEIPRLTDYEQGVKRGLRYDTKTGQWSEDMRIADERFVMCKLKDKGLVMFTGCSHAGVVNASREAVRLGDNSPLYAVFGGYHLADADADLIANTVSDLQKLKPSSLIAGHCTGWRAKFEIEKTMPGKLVPSFVGSKFVL